VLFTHAHVDHMAGVVWHCATRKLRGMQPPTYVVGRENTEAFRELFAVWRRLDRSELPHELVELVGAVDALPDPFPAGRTYAAFLDGELTTPGREAIEAWDAPGEWARVLGPHIVLRLGISAHQAKLTNARIERFGVLATTRDLTVVRALADRWGGAPRA
jgi:hypothetical protein